MNSGKEIWKSIKGFSDYEVSNLGRIKSHKRRHLHTALGYCIVMGFISNGYRHIYLCKEGKKFQFRIHHLVLGAFVGPRPPGHETNHEDGIKTNNRLDNLE